MCPKFLTNKMVGRGWPCRDAEQNVAEILALGWSLSKTKPSRRTTFNEESTGIMAKKRPHLAKKKRSTPGKKGDIWHAWTIVHQLKTSKNAIIDFFLFDTWTRHCPTLWPSKTSVPLGPPCLDAGLSSFCSTPEPALPSWI